MDVVWRCLLVASLALALWAAMTVNLAQFAVAAVCAAYSGMAVQREH